MSDSKRCKSCGNPVDLEVAKAHDGACPWCLAEFTFGPEPTGTPAISPAEASTRFGKYVRTEKLGAGGMGEVWKALDTELNRWVALKFLKDPDPRELARFQREARTAAGLSHPNIASIFEISETEGRSFIAMQYVTGRTMETFPRDDRKLVLGLIRDAARAVDHAHRLGIIHRDLKPENLMVEKADDGWRVVVLDFGLARQIEGGEKLSMSGDVVGTPAYMSPEQARGAALDERADVYSLGATLYEVLTGRPPFEGPNLFEVIRKVGSEEPVRPRKLDPKIHRDLETIVLKCLEKDRNRRYPSARELADDLDRFLNLEPIFGRPQSTIYRLRMRLGKRKAVMATAAAGLLGILVVAGLILGSHDRLDAARTRAGTHVDLARLKIDQLEQLMRIDEDRRAEIEKLASAAREELGEALNSCPEHEEACFEMGRMFALTDRTDKALEYFTRAIGLAPRQTKAYLGRATLNLDAYEEIRHISGSGQVRDESEVSRVLLSRLNEDLQKVRSLSSEVPQLKFAEGMLLFSKGEFAEAAARLAEYLNLAPTDSTGWLWRGHAEQHAHAPAAADQSLTRALSLRPRMPGAHRLRAFVKRDLGLFDEAIADFTRALELVPKSPVVFRARGFAKHLKGLHGEALADLTRAIELNPKDSLAYRQRANCKHALGRLDEAIADCTKALELDPKDAVAYGNRGDSKYFKGLVDEAIADYSMALELDPKLAGAYANRGLAKTVKGLHDDAIADCTKAIELDPKLAGAYSSRGIAKRSKGLHDQAIADYNRAIELDPKQAPFYYNRGISKADKGLYDEAIADYAKAIELDPKDASIYCNRGLMKASQGLNDAAIADYTKSIELDPKVANTYCNRGIVKAAKGLYDEAIADFTKSIELNPMVPRYWTWRGHAWHSKELFDEAIADYTKAMELDPNYLMAYYNRGSARIAKGLHDEAAADLRRALEIAPPGWRHRAAVEAHLAVPREAILFREGSKLHESKKYREAIAKFKAVVEGHPKSREAVSSAYNIACGHALLGEKKDALDWLEKSLQMGWSDRSHMEEDSDLDSLRGEERYRKLVEKLKSE